MKHETTTLAVIGNFGAISSCNCGLYHVNLPGVSIHLNKEHFHILVQLVAEAKRNLGLCNSGTGDQKNNHLYVVKH
jgi:hypothetical protein